LGLPNGCTQDSRSGFDAWTEEAVLAGFGVVMLALAVYGFRQRD